uniref:Uncharacterized protein n=1 Tax=Anopheles dirus TaxID=7168 RepID=A0A182NVX8_9DIPT
MFRARLPGISAKLPQRSTPHYSPNPAGVLCTVFCCARSPAQTSLNAIWPQTGRKSVPGATMLTTARNIAPQHVRCCVFGSDPASKGGGEQKHGARCPSNAARSC